MQIKLTDKAREALLLAELVAWARQDTSVQLDDLSWALRQQHETTTEKLVLELEENDLDELHLLQVDIHNLQKTDRNRALKFEKIPLGDSIYKALEKAALESEERGLEGELSTGMIFCQMLFDSKDFAEKIKELKLDSDKLKSQLLSLAFDDSAFDDEIDAGHAALSRFNRQLLNWLRDGNLTEELLKKHGIEAGELLFNRTVQMLIQYLGEEENDEIPDIRPPLVSGIRDKARRDLVVADSFISAKNLPEPEPTLIGMFLNSAQEFILFYESYCQISDGTQSIIVHYEGIQEIETFCQEELEAGTATATIAITYGDNMQVELEVPSCTGDIPDVFALDNFFEHARQPQSISTIESDADFVTFLKRQNNNLDLYYRLAYKTEELWQLGWWENEKGAQQTLLLRLLAILVTLPVQSVSVGSSGFR